MWAKAHVTRGFTNPRLKPGDNQEEKKWALALHLNI